MDPKLKMLCELYNRSDENINTDALLKVCFFENFKEVLKLLSETQCVRFAYLCVKSVSHLCNKFTKEKVKKCLELIEEWLKNTNSISYYELRKAAHDAYNTVHDARNATYTADADTAYAAYATAYAIYSGGCYAANDAVSVAAHSIHAITVAAHAAHAAENKQEQEYKVLGFLVKVIKDEP